MAEEADESEPDEEMSDGGGETELQQRTAGHIITDWDPMTGTLADYRVLEREEDAFSGEEYFMGNPVSGYHRYYKPTTSEREDPSFVNDAAPPGTRLASIYSRTYTHMSFDHIISWTMDEKHDYGLFCKTVIMGEWDHDFPRYSRLYLESNR